ncbi:hypothetical protein GUJ93_ZPchr0008g11789 [Zizania palustris]|uniref:DC1 domain-containing protein n=1 Tax=Zizania palustris TaxID=103762 RepID=A0A8J5RWZ4_ZIZPA|nr:hypothetical protein GUJ93_ZPchr0008g11789 [Zizania palustris]
MKVKTSNDTPAEISHPFHPAHSLKLVTAAAETVDEFLCDGCKEHGAAGCPRYTCEACDFDLHSACALAADVLPEHALFKGGASFVLLHEPPPTDPGGRRVCDACGDEVRGFVYHCFESDLDIHPCCACLPGRIAFGDIAFELCGGGGAGSSSRAPRRCAFCTGPERSRRARREFWRYRSDYDGEAMYLHVACVKKKTYESLAAGHFHRTHDDDGKNMKVMRASVLNGALQKKGRTSKAFKRFLKIVFFVVRVVGGVLFGDPTAMVVAVVGLLLPDG